ncbi:hypothetical protein B296_00041407 [Ensete ventricosum]|uniref:Uncharacterized protein n=1 Tax=Ensete ventricosum TaxID=4639 RepID=A0A426YZX7_ENSVE|nr:hypothetical protein B296_00041407 [Ensete ventricosum]
MLTDVGLSNTVTYLRVRNPPKLHMISAHFPNLHSLDSSERSALVPCLSCSQVDMFSMEMEILEYDTSLDLEGCSGDCIGEESQSSKCICGGRTRHQLSSKTE